MNIQCWSNISTSLWFWLLIVGSFLASVFQVWNKLTLFHCACCYHFVDAFIALCFKLQCFSLCLFFFSHPKDISCHFTFFCQLPSTFHLWFLEWVVYFCCLHFLSSLHNVLISCNPAPAFWNYFDLDWDTTFSFFQLNISFLLPCHPAYPSASYTYLDTLSLLCFFSWHLPFSCTASQHQETFLCLQSFIPP